MMDLSSEISLLEEDIQDFNIEKDVRTTLKSQEELDKLTVDESLNEIDRAVFILSSGQEVQCLSVLHHLPHLIKGWQNECMRRVMPKVKDIIHSSGVDLQLMANEVFTTIAKEELLQPAVYTQYFLRTIITNINNKDPFISQSWLNTLLSVINYLPKETIRREVLGLAVAKGQLSQPTASRLSCCSILGAIASKFEPNIIKKDFVQTVKQLCQDVEHNVRACMCTHLHTIAITLGAEETRRLILDEVLELAADEESQVREAAVEAILNMCSLLDDETLSQNVVPIICRYCEQALVSEDHTLLSVAKNFGRFCFYISKNFNAEQHSWMLSKYRHLCMLGRTPSHMAEGYDLLTLPGLENVSVPSSPASNNRSSNEKQEEYLECRRLCAYNFPALTSFCIGNEFEDCLLECASMLCTDQDCVVRKHFAAGIHEVAQSLEAQAYLIHSHVVMLLREKLVSSVLEACLRRLPDTLTAVITRGNLIDNKVNGVSEIIGSLLTAITHLELMWPSSWRALETMVTHMRRLSDVLSSDQIYYKFVPVVFKLLTTNRYLPVREAAACTVCVFIRHNRKLDQRKEMCDRLIQDLCYSKTYRNRILFFEACRHMMVLFSRAFFKEYLFEHVLRLFYDPIPNVRLCLCKILPSMKALLKLPRDRSLHGQLETSVRKLLSSEKDRDVSSAIRIAILELDRTEVAMESLTQNRFLDVDLQDQRKEEEERLFMMQDEKNKDEDARSLKSHGSGHSSSSMGKAMAGRSEKNKGKKRNSSLSQVGTTSSSLKVNGSRDKPKSLQTIAAHNTSTFVPQRDGITPNSSLPSLYNLNTSTTTTANPSNQNRNLANHFSYLSGGNNPASQGPSTALGHKGPSYMTQGRQTGSNPAFIGTMGIAQQGTLSSHSSKPRKSDRRKVASAMSFQNTEDTFATEPRTRKGSGGSVSSTGSGGRGKATAKSSLAKKNGSPNSPIPSYLKNKKEKTSTAR